MKKILFVLLLSVVLPIFFTVEDHRIISLLPEISINDEVIHHSYYTLSYNEDHEQANWVAYKLTSDMIQNGLYSRTDNFKPDYKVKSQSSQLSDYKGSGYDRGHLCPAGDMKISKIAMSESFYMSNMSPQSPSFNRGIWKSLESIVRTWAIENDEIYIVTGPILAEEFEFLGSIGSNSVSIPKYYYKVILDYKKPELKGIGFILENTKGQLPLVSYAISIDTVEDLTGIDFFPSLPDTIENIIEGSFSIDKWSWGKNK